MELSEAKEILEDVKGIYIEPAECGLSSGSVSKAILTILQELDNSISKDKIREKIEKLKEIADEDNIDEFIKISILQDLLKEE